VIRARFEVATDISKGSTAFFLWRTTAMTAAAMLIVHPRTVSAKA
jgi:heme exporter protein D